MERRKESSGILEIFDGCPAHGHYHVLKIVDLVKFFGDSWQSGTL
jgi:hypothetical protein